MSLHISTSFHAHLWHYHISCKWYMPFQWSVTYCTWSVIRHDRDLLESGKAIGSLYDRNTSPLSIQMFTKAFANAASFGKIRSIRTRKLSVRLPNNTNLVYQRTLKSSCRFHIFKDISRLHELKRFWSKMLPWVFDVKHIGWEVVIDFMHQPVTVVPANPTPFVNKHVVPSFASDHNQHQIIRLRAVLKFKPDQYFLYNVFCYAQNVPHICRGQVLNFNYPFRMSYCGGRAEIMCAIVEDFSFHIISSMNGSGVIHNIGTSWIVSIGTHMMRSYRSNKQVDICPPDITSYLFLSLA